MLVVIFISSGRQNQGINVSTFVHYVQNHYEAEKEVGCCFLLPVIRDNTNAIFNGDIPRSRICHYALQWILNIRPDKWKGIMTEATQKSS
jgi:hypothetical protein